MGADLSRELIQAEILSLGFSAGHGGYCVGGSTEESVNLYCCWDDTTTQRIVKIVAKHLESTSGGYPQLVHPVNLDTASRRVTSMYRCPLQEYLEGGGAALSKGAEASYNSSYLYDKLLNPSFCAGDVTRGWIDQVRAALTVSLAFEPARERQGASDRNVLLSKHYLFPELYRRRRASAVDEHNESSSLRTVLHPGLLPLVGVIEGSSSWALVFQHVALSLADVLRCPTSEMLPSDLHKRFLVYQLLRALSFAHDRGVLHGALSPQCVFVTPQMWVNLGGWCTQPRIPRQLQAPTDLGTEAWVRGDLSNLEYLLRLNVVGCGRRRGDPLYHPFLPWVIDFVSPTSFRDLSVSKYRLQKGDAQLDFTFEHGAASERHHIPEPLSSLTYYNYIARRTPVEVLKLHVRSNFEANEYPATMGRLYDWSPDEAIPEFYEAGNESLFAPVYDHMAPLEIPEWAEDATQFLRMHREALESPQVSAALHHWIDLAFGYKLSGKAGIEAKNVPLTQLSSARGFVQLFDTPHPPRVEPAKPLDEVFSHRLSVTAALSDSSSVVQAAAPAAEDAATPRSAFARKFAGPKTPVQMFKTIVREEIKEEEEDIETYYDTHSLPSETTSKINALSSLLHNAAAPSSVFVRDMVEMEVLAETGTVTQGVYYPGGDDELISQDLFAFGCIFAEVFTGKPLFSEAQLQHFLHSGGPLPDLSLLPSTIRGVIASLVSRRDQSAQRLLQNTRLFPGFFAPLYALLQNFYAAPNVKDRARLVMDNMYLLDEVSHGSAFLVALPHLRALLHPQAVCNETVALLDAICAKLGPRQCRKRLAADVTTLLGVGTTLINHNAFRMLFSRFGAECTCLKFLFHYLEAARTDHTKVGKCFERVARILAPIPYLRCIVYPLLYRFDKPHEGDSLIKVISTCITSLPLTTVENIFIPYVNHLLANQRSIGRGLEFLALLLPQMSLEQVIFVLSPEGPVLQLLVHPSPDPALMLSFAGVLLSVCHFAGADLTTQLFLPRIAAFFGRYPLFYNNAGRPSVPPGDPRLQMYSVDTAMAFYIHLSQLVGAEALRRTVGAPLAVVEELLRSAAAPPDIQLIVMHEPHRFEEDAPAARRNKKKIGEILVAAGDGASERLESCGGGLLRRLRFENEWLKERASPQPPLEGRTKFCFRAHASPIRCMDVHDETTAVTGSKDATLRAWRLGSSKCLASFAHRRALLACAFCDGGRLVASTDGTLRVWNVQSSASAVAEWNCAEAASEFTCLAVADNAGGSQRLYAGSSSNSVSVIDLGSERESCLWKTRLRAHSGARALEQLHECSLLLVGSSSGFVTALDTRDGSLVTDWKAHQQPITAMRRGAGDLLMTASTDRSVKLWRLGEWQRPLLVGTYVGHSDPVVALDSFQEVMYSGAGAKFGATEIWTDSDTYKLSPTKLKGSISALRYMPLHGGLLAAVDSSVHLIV